MQFGLLAVLALALALPVATALALALTLAVIAVLAPVAGSLSCEMLTSIGLA